MASTEDLFFGSLAVTKGFASSEQINQCLRQQVEEEAAGRPRRMLGQILLEKGFLTVAQVQELSEEQTRLTKTRKIGPYELLGKLGQGGMGTVFKAKDPKTGEPVALKVLPRSLCMDETLVSRFLREAQLGMEMRHPNIVRTLDHGEEQGVHFLALELVEGGDLDQRVTRQGRLSERESVAIVREVVRALSYAHDRGLVHRDIKPANIMFDKEGKVKLSDFGLVKSADPKAADLTQTGEIMGTPMYLSPEQARGEKDVDFRSDMYSLGATLYYLVTGRKPFEGKTQYEVVAKHLSEPLRSPAEHNPELGQGCVAMIVKMMAKDREHRYQSWEELAVDLDRLLRNETPLRAALPKPPTRASASPPPAFHSQPAAPRPVRADSKQDQSRTKPLLIGVAAAALLLALLLGYLGSCSRNRQPVAEPAKQPAQKTPEIATAPDLRTAPVTEPAPRPAQAAPVFLSDLPELEVRTLDKQSNFYDKWSFGKGRFGKDGEPIQVQGQPSPHGLAMNVPGDRSAATVSYALDKKFGAFTAVAAINDSARRSGTGGSASPLTFRVFGDGKIRWQSKALQRAGSSESCEVDLSGVDRLELQVECAGSHWYGQGVWVEPQVVPAPAK